MADRPAGRTAAATAFASPVAYAVPMPPLSLPPKVLRVRNLAARHIPFRSTLHHRAHTHPLVTRTDAAMPLDPVALGLFDRAAKVAPEDGAAAPRWTAEDEALLRDTEPAALANRAPVTHTTPAAASTVFWLRRTEYIANDSTPARRGASPVSTATATAAAAAAAPMGARVDASHDAQVRVIERTFAAAAALDASDHAALRHPRRDVYATRVVPVVPERAGAAWGELAIIELDPPPPPSSGDVSRAVLRHGTDERTFVLHVPSPTDADDADDADAPMPWVGEYAAAQPQPQMNRVVLSIATEDDAAPAMVALITTRVAMKRKNAAQALEPLAVVRAPS